MTANKLKNTTLNMRNESIRSEASTTAKIVATYKAIATKSIENLIKSNPENNYFAHSLLLPGNEAKKHRNDISSALEAEGFDCTVNSDSIYVVLKIK